MTKGEQEIGIVHLPDDRSVKQSTEPDLPRDHGAGAEQQHLRKTPGVGATVARRGPGEQQRGDHQCAQHVTGPPDRDRTRERGQLDHASEPEATASDERTGEGTQECSQQQAADVPEILELGVGSSEPQQQGGRGQCLERVANGDQGGSGEWYGRGSVGKKGPQGNAGPVSASQQRQGCDGNPGGWPHQRDALPDRGVVQT